LRTRVQRRFTIGKRQHRLVCRIDVMDNGPGIPSEMQDTIFFPMISGRADGTGLGLAIAQSIMAQHHGMIECESVPGSTRFSLYLPLDV
jgi:two-component system nitrogen regulation sensor histidine kinase GlnL